MPPFTPPPPYRHLPPPPSVTRPTTTKPTTLLRPYKRTNPLTWCLAILCVIFSLLLILAGILTLILFLVVKPCVPLFDTSGATLNSVYLDSSSPPAAYYLNADLTFLANFSNPNSKLDVAFEYVGIELFFYGRLVAAQALQPFVQGSGEARLQAVHMVTSEVYLPPELAAELQKQVRGNNRVVYFVRGTFRVRASLGVVHFSYWLYGRCRIELTAPPGGVLVARSCRTSR